MGSGLSRPPSPGPKSSTPAGAMHRQPEPASPSNSRRIQASNTADVPRPPTVANTVPDSPRHADPSGIILIIIHFDPSSRTRTTERPNRLREVLFQLPPPRLETPKTRGSATPTATTDTTATPITPPVRPPPLQALHPRLPAGLALLHLGLVLPLRTSRLPGSGPGPGLDFRAAATPAEFLAYRAKLRERRTPAADRLYCHDRDGCGVFLLSRRPGSQSGSQSESQSESQSGSGSVGSSSSREGTWAWARGAADSGWGRAPPGGPGRTALLCPLCGRRTCKLCGGRSHFGPGACRGANSSSSGGGGGGGGGGGRYASKKEAEEGVFEDQAAKEEWASE
ncbi:hypothetical protein VTG60DRAFT_5489 [Thermothelomyces hinnuleus]